MAHFQPAPEAISPLYLEQQGPLFSSLLFASNGSRVGSSMKDIEIRADELHGESLSFGTALRPSKGEMRPKCSLYVFKMLCIFLF